MAYIAKLNLVWNVIRYNMNTKKIEPFNIFDHCNFRKDLEKLLNETNISKEGFEEKLRKEVMYYFWAKAEYEVLIRSWCGGNGDEEVKIDIYEQVRWNWDKFVDYVWNHSKSNKNVLGTKKKIKIGADCLECQNLNSCMNAYFNGTKVRCIAFGNIEKYVTKATQNDEVYKTIIDKMIGRKE